MGRLFLPYFDWSTKISTKEWVEKLDIYFQLNKFPEMEAIKVAALHLEGEAHDWWFHGLSTLGHANVTAYFEFTRRVVEIFDRRYLEAPFMSLTKLKKSGSVESYISEFLRLSVMVPDLSATRRVYMFIDGLDEPLHGLVKYTKPPTLHDSIEMEIYLQDALPKAKENFQNKSSFSSKGKEEKNAPSKESTFRKPLDIEAQRDLRRKKLCFTFQEPWFPRHRCATGKTYYIEVFSDLEKYEDDELRGGHSADNVKGDPAPSGDGNGAFYPMGGTLAYLRGVPKYLTL